MDRYSLLPLSSIVISPGIGTLEVDVPLVGGRVAGGVGLALSLICSAGSADVRSGDAAAERALADRGDIGTLWSIISAGTSSSESYSFSISSTVLRVACQDRLPACAPPFEVEGRIPGDPGGAGAGDGARWALFPTGVAAETALRVPGVYGMRWSEVRECICGCKLGYTGLFACPFVKSLKFPIAEVLLRDCVFMLLSGLPPIPPRLRVNF